MLLSVAIPTVVDKLTLPSLSDLVTSIPPFSSLLFATSRMKKTLTVLRSRRVWKVKSIVRSSSRRSWPQYTVSHSLVRESKFRSSWRSASFLRLTLNFTRQPSILQESQSNVSETCSEMLIRSKTGSLNVQRSLQAQVNLLSGSVHLAYHACSLTSLWAPSSSWRLFFRKLQWQRTWTNSQLIRRKILQPSHPTTCTQLTLHIWCWLQLSAKS